MVIDGMPQPARVGLLADKALHLIHLSFASTLDIHPTAASAAVVATFAAASSKTMAILIECP